MNLAALDVVQVTHKQFTEPIFARLTDYKVLLEAHPLLEAGRNGELDRSTLEEFAFHQFSDSILWIPMLAQMKRETRLRSGRLKKAIAENIGHEAGLVGPDHQGESHVALAVAMMRSLGIYSVDRFPEGAFEKTLGQSLNSWLSNEIADYDEPEMVGWLLASEALVPVLFESLVPSFDALPNCDTRYFHEHIAVDADEHARWMAESVDDILGIYGPDCVAAIFVGMHDGFTETRAVPDDLWRRHLVGAT
jgi:hypothetical protein